MNEKFPVLSIFSWLLRAFAIIIVVVSLDEIPWKEIYAEEAFDRLKLFSCLLGLIIAMCLAVIGEVIGVLFAIEKNTRTINQISIKELQGDRLKVQTSPMPQTPLKNQTSSKPQAPPIIAMEDIPNIIIRESKSVLGVNETEIDKPLVQVLRIAPGEVARFIDELEDNYGFVMTQQSLRQIQTVKDIIQSIVKK
ncbi:hypothetical protein N9961_02095 [bacterium]|nr:hypothetical protein [bacterium]